MKKSLKLKKSWKNTFWRIDYFLEKHLMLAVGLLIVTILRIPGFFEPYWYGDEGMYLTIGQAINKGLNLYSDIFDHKTPLIYYFSTLGTQLNLRLFLLIWMLATTTIFYALLEKILIKKWAVAVGLIFFVIMTNTPWLEANIANGEIFMMGFVLAGVLSWLYSNTGQAFLKLSEKKDTKPKKNQPQETPIIYLAVGALFGLATLTKVPSILELGVIFAGILIVYIHDNDYKIYFFSLKPIFSRLRLSIISLKTNFSRLKLNFINLKPSFAQLKPSLVSRTLNFSQLRLNLIDLKNKFLHKTKLATSLKTFCKPTLFIILGLLGTLLISMFYFYSKNSLTEYINYGFLYNLQYANTWTISSQSLIIQFLFSFPGKILILIALIIYSLTLKNHILKLLGIWLALTITASTLSNRPYPHYFIQVLPALSLLLAFLAEKIYLKKITKNQILAVIPILFILALNFAVIGAKPYPMLSYYSNFINWSLSNKTTEQYYQAFDHLVIDNYKVASLIKNDQEEHIFIWGNNPGLYALAQKLPAGRFTATFHIIDQDALNETFADIIGKNPKYIVVMHSEHHPFDRLFKHLYQNYIQNNNYEHLTLWTRKSDL